MNRWRRHPAGRAGWRVLVLGFLFFCAGVRPAAASRFALFALDIQVPFQQGQAVGEARKAAIEKGLRQAVEEATYKIIPPEGLDTGYQKLKDEVLKRPGRFVPQYMILGEKRFPDTFDLSLQVTVDLVLLRKALLSVGLLKAGKSQKAARQAPFTLEIKGLTDGKVLLEMMTFFKQRPDLAEGFRLVSACHGDFVFQFIPIQPPAIIASQVLYHAQISEGTFKVVHQDKDCLVLAYQLGPSS